jgi:hypothetical protein
MLLPRNYHPACLSTRVAEITQFHGFVLSSERTERDLNTLVDEMRGRELPYSAQRYRLICCLLVYLQVN